ncbi:MAG TPA: hypothetical protein VLS48_04810 [Anaerolineales bacterium]|nr:hypothetical protein [Anaerolineales bacterium]
MPKKVQVDKDGAVFTYNTEGPGKFLVFSNATDMQGESDKPRRSYNRKRPAPTSDQRSAWRDCPFCRQTIKRADFREHIRINHPEKFRDRSQDATAGSSNRPRRNEAERPSYRSAQVEDTAPDVRTLRRLGKAKPPRKENVPVGMVQCSVCNALVPRSRLEEHIEKKHGEKEETELEKCARCGAEVRADRMEKHLRKVHKIES